MSRPVIIFNNRKEVIKITPNDVMTFIGEDYHFVNHPDYKEPDYKSANFGDILVCELSTNHLYITPTYDVVKYPVDEYEPIAVCIYDAASHRDNLSVWMSIQWCNVSQAGARTPLANSAQDSSWGHGNYNISETENTLIQNQRIKDIDNTDWRTKTSWKASDYNTYWPAFELCWRYTTPGTNEGDWYLVSYFDITKAVNNYQQLENIVTSIKTLSNEKYLKTVKQWTYLSSAQNGSSNAGTWKQFKIRYMSYAGKTGKVPIRPVLIK